MKYLCRRNFLKQAVKYGALGFSATIPVHSLFFENSIKSKTERRVCRKTNKITVSPISDLRDAYLLADDDNSLGIIKLLHDYRVSGCPEEKILEIIRPSKYNTTDLIGKYHVIFISGDFDEAKFQNVRQEAISMNPEILIPISKGADFVNTYKQLWDRELMITPYPNSSLEKIVKVIDALYLSFQMPGGLIELNLSDFLAEFSKHLFWIETIEGTGTRKDLCAKFIVKNRDDFKEADKIFAILSFKSSDYDIEEISMFHQMMKKSMRETTELFIIDTIACHLNTDFRLTALFTLSYK